MKNIRAFFNYIFFMPAPIVTFFLTPRRCLFIDGEPLSDNFGDALNIPLVEFLSERKILGSSTISRVLFRLFRFKSHAVIGSVLQRTKLNAEIWGTGFMSDNTTFFSPSKIHAVRGPKSREIYLKHNIDCPPIYGDPALLCPFMYWPVVEKKYKLGIIPHYCDYNNEWVEEMRKKEEVLVINLMVGVKYKEVIDKILSCEKILSSSLHGIIISDAYRIPNSQIMLSDKVVGADFKFSDYYLSVNRKIQTAINPVNINLADIIYNETIHIDISKLLEVCPFIVKERKKMILDRIRNEEQFNHLKGAKKSHER